jgi:hypothetical protein
VFGLVVYGCFSFAADVRRLEVRDQWDELLEESRQTLSEAPNWIEDHFGLIYQFLSVAVLLVFAVVSSFLILRWTARRVGAFIDAHPLPSTRVDRAMESGPLIVAAKDVRLEWQRQAEREFEELGDGAESLSASSTPYETRSETDHRLGSLLRQAVAGESEPK